MLADLVAMGTADSVKYDETQYQRSLPLMTTVIKGLVGRDLYNDNSSTTYYRIVNPALDPVYREAVAIIRDPELYQSLLTGTAGHD